MAMYLYNGVLLPEIPADVLAQYPICWIRLNSDGSTYDLICGKHTWYAVGSTIYISTPSTYVWYTATASAEAWTYKTSYTDDGAFNVTNDYIWSSHDITMSTGNATEIYCYGSEPIDPNAPVEPEEPDIPEINITPKVICEKQDLVNIADAIREKTGKADSLSLEQMATEIEGIEAGGIPKNARLYYVGYAVSETALRVESENNAVGILE